jgi:hypothetical protein
MLPSSLSLSLLPLPLIISTTFLFILSFSVIRTLRQVQGVWKIASQIWKLIYIYSEDIYSVLNCHNAGKHRVLPWTFMIQCEFHWYCDRHATCSKFLATRYAASLASLLQLRQKFEFGA